MLSEPQPSGESVSSNGVSALVRTREAEELQQLLALGLWLGGSLSLVSSIYAGVEGESLQKHSWAMPAWRSGKPGRPPAERFWGLVVLARFWYLQKKEAEKPWKQRRRLEALADQALQDLRSWLGRDKIPNWSARRVINLASEKDGRYLGFLLGVPGKTPKIPKDYELQQCLAQALLEQAGSRQAS